MIKYEDFEKVEIRVGTVIEARLNDYSIKPSIIANNETWLLDTDFGPHHQLPNYNFIHNHRIKGRGG